MKIDKINLGQKNYKYKANKNNKISDINFKGYTTTRYIYSTHGDGTSGIGFNRDELNEHIYRPSNAVKDITRVDIVDEKLEEIRHRYREDGCYPFSAYITDPDEEINTSKLKGLDIYLEYKEPGFRIYFSDIEKAIQEGKTDELDFEKAQKYDEARNYEKVRESWYGSQEYKLQQEKILEQKKQYAELQELVNSISEYSKAIGTHSYLTEKINELDKTIKENAILGQILDTNLQNAQRAYDEDDEDDEIFAELIYARTKKAQIGATKPISSEEIKKLKEEKNACDKSLKEIEESEEYKNAAVEIPPVLEKIKGIYEENFPDKITRPAV